MSVEPPTDAEDARLRRLAALPAIPTVVALQREPLRRLREWVEQFHPDWGSDEESLANYADRLPPEPTASKESP